ncbi:MAG: IS200/IS605 family transposase [Sulfurovum sp.]|nr:IS200/IS605 family transposase [Sulfurovum sp.]
MEDQHIYKSHNKTLLLYHLVFPAKYRKKIFGEEVDKTLKEVCLEISDCYEIHFVEIGNDLDHVHFLVQSVPTLSVTRIVTIIKSITAREIFAKHKEVKKMLWGGNLWTSGFYANTVGMYSNQEVIKKYIQNQGRENMKYTKLYQGKLALEL